MFIGLTIKESFLSEVVLLQGPLPLILLSHCNIPFRNTQKDMLYVHHKLGGKLVVCRPPEYHWIWTLKYLMN